MCGFSPESLFLICGDLCPRLNFLFLTLVRGGFWLIDAERLLIHEVAGRSVSASAAAHADVAKFAAPAFTFQPIAVAELCKHCRIVPNICECLLAQIARQRGKVSAGINFALVRDEAHARPRQAALRHCVHRVGPARVTTGMSVCSGRK